jgi:hypothetical protein
VHRDPQFLADAAKIGLEISPIGAAEMAHAIDGLGQAPPSVLAYMRKLMARH